MGLFSKAINAVFREPEKVLAWGEAMKRQYVPPGNFHSPIVDIAEAEKDRERIWAVPKSLKGISLNEEGQLALLKQFAEKYYPSIPFKVQRGGLRYCYDNPSYGHSYAAFLHCIIRHARPERIIDVGCGNSSCVILDTNELFFSNSIKCIFIDPYPQLLKSLLKAGDGEKIDIIPNRLQDVPLVVFKELKENDILFIDSTHVSKTGSDVNYLFFEILPSLKKGVLIHFHDISYPFEYPEEWIKEGRSWNENYMMRCFLAYNKSFEIVLFNTYLQTFHREWFEKNMPLCLKNPGGSLWIRKAAD